LCGGFAAIHLSVPHLPPFAAPYLGQGQCHMLCHDPDPTRYQV